MTLFSLAKKIKTRITKIPFIPARLGLIAETLVIVWISIYSVEAVATEDLTENFDSFSPGTVLVDQVEAVSFPLALEVFVPPESRTESPPNAVRNVLDCNDEECSNGAYRVEIEFTTRARTVSLRAGDVLVGCFEFDCPIAQLIGFNEAGEIVAASMPKPIPTGTFEDPAGLDAEITELFEIDARAFTISRAVLFVGKDDNFDGDFGAPRTAQIDSLEYTVLEEGEPPPPPEPPEVSQVEITDPLPDDIFLDTDPFVSGRVTAPTGVAAFCVVANETTFPARCDEAAAVQPNDDGDLVFGPMRIQGELIPNSSNLLTAFLRDGLGRLATDTVSIDISPGTLDLTVEAIEPTQIVQIKDIPTQADAGRIPRAISSVPGFAAVYLGVPFAQQKKTIVRVFVSGAFEATGGLGTARVRDVPVLLHGFTSGVGDLPGTPEELPGSPIRPDAGTPPVIEDAFNLAVQRADPEGGYTFTLPDSWTQQSEIIIAAEVAPPATTAEFNDARPNDNGLYIEDIPFLPQRRLDVWPVSLRSTVGGVTSRPARPLSQFFEDVVVVTPAPIRLHPALAEVDITEPVVRLRNPDGTFDKDPAAEVIERAIDLIAEATEDRDLDGRIIGLTSLGVGGKGPGSIAATGSIKRKLDFVAHELYHTYGFKHASSDCGAGGAQDWRPDQRGLIHGIGLDPRFGSGGGTRLYRPIGRQDPAVFDATPPAPEVHDFMSYCSDELDADDNKTWKTWLSTDYWTSAVRGFVPGGDLPLEPTCCRLSGARDTSTGRDILRVTSIINPDSSGQILRVSSVQAKTDKATLGTGVELRLRDSAGDIVASTEVEPVEFSARPAPGLDDPGPSWYVAATLDGSDAQSAELVVDGAVLATRQRSVHAPTVQIQRTPTGHCVDFAGSPFVPVPADADFMLDYIAADTDGDALRGKVEFSLDGKRWRALSTGIVDSPVTLSGSLLSQSDAAYLRVTVNDGFNSAADICGPFATEGRGVTVNIVSPKTGAELNADGIVHLEGFAFDDSGDSISDAQLKWFSGEQLLGQGEVLTVPAYLIDVLEGITLIAEAGDGSVGQTSVDVSIQQVRPLFTRLEPRPLRGQAKVIALRVSASIPKLLHVTGPGIEPSTYLVSPESRNITIKLVEQLETYNLRLQLGDGDLRTTKKLTVERI